MSDPQPFIVTAPTLVLPRGCGFGVEVRDPSLWPQLHDDGFRLHTAPSDGDAYIRLEPGKEYRLT